MTLLRSLFAARRLGRTRRCFFQPRLETLEDRLAPAGYTPTDLGAPSITGDIGDLPAGNDAINNSGQVATSVFAISASGPSVLKTALYSLNSNGPWQPLNPPSGYAQTYPKGINDAGQVLIDAETQGGSYGVFLYDSSNNSGTGWTNLNAPSGYSQTLPEGLNGAGEVFINTSTQNNVSQLYLSSNKGPFQPPMNEPSGYSSFEGLGINKSGQLLVGAITTSGVSKDLVYDNGQWNDIGTNSLLVVSGAINDSGQVVIETTDLSSHHYIYSYNNSQWSAPGALPSGYSNPILAGLNNTGQILIEASTGSGSSAVTHPLLYSDGQWTDLNSFMPSGSKVTLTGTGGINNKGAIVADGSDGHIYLLQPDAAPVVTLDPTNQRVTAGGTVEFTAAASGVPTPTGQWQFSVDGGNTWNNDANPVTGTTSIFLKITDVVATANGHEFRCVFTNGVGSPAITNAATLTVQIPPAFTSGNSAVFTVGQNGSFTVTATGSPTPTLSVSGRLPSGVTFTDDGNGTAILEGAPAAGTQGTYQFTITASNGAGNDPQNFTLTLNPAPVPPSPPPSSPPSSPSAPPSPPALDVPPLLALFDSLLGGTETVNANGTETIADFLFGIPLMVSTFDQSGHVVSVTLFGFNVTFLFG